MEGQGLWCLAISSTVNFAMSSVVLAGVFVLPFLQARIQQLLQVNSGMGEEIRLLQAMVSHFVNIFRL